MHSIPKFTVEPKIINSILKLATVSAGSFLVSVFAMTQVSMITTPGGYFKNVVASDFLIPKVVGLLALSAILSLSGWVKSKKVGLFTTAIGVMTLLLILTTMIQISSE
ncbi:MAG: hypothetical protein ACJAWV_003708 [Flammeovirgaceae bacterium]